MRRFTRSRRLVALAMHALLLQLALTSGAVRCPFGDGTTHTAAATTAHAGAPHEHGRAPSPPAPDHQSGTHCADMSCLLASCTVADHCAPSAATVGVAPVAVLASLHDGVISDEDGPPRYAGVPPEPPPPRA